MDLKLAHYNQDGIEVIDVGGDIDIHTAPRLRQLLIDLINKKHYQLVINLERVEFLDSSGLGVIVGGIKRVRLYNGSLRLVCSQENILRMFHITGLTRVIGIYGSVDEAINSKNPAAAEEHGANQDEEPVSEPLRKLSK